MRILNKGDEIIIDNHACAVMGVFRKANSNTYMIVYKDLKLQEVLVDSLVTVQAKLKKGDKK